MTLETDSTISVFLRKSVAVDGFPFDVRPDLPSRETVEAMLEAEKIAKDPGIETLSADDALEALKK